MSKLKINFFLLVAISIFLNCGNEITDNPQSLEEYPIYSGADLGLNFSKEQSTFKVWAPSASELKIRFYELDLGGEAIIEKNLESRKDGLWEITIDEDLEGKYYTFEAKVNDLWLGETTDPYVKAVGRNGKRGQVIDFAKTNPEGWENDSKPPMQNWNDAVIYELHFRDLSTHSSAGIENKGKFLGLTELGTTNPNGMKTGLDHIKELGVTHIHILPSYDFKSIDESKLEENEFNWGYDPQNYNVPDGSYSTNPADGATRIREFKQMVKTLHENGLRVILDVVYNHTFDTESPFELLVPGYYYRKDTLGNFSNASGCGNETASERPMMRKFMIESVKYWVEEYHLDGFRFDLMGIHDIETMNQISEVLHTIDPSIMIYGEGWTAGDSPLAGEDRALKNNVSKLVRAAAFSDDLRDGAKGHVFTHEAKAFVSGEPDLEESVKFGIVAATNHPQVKYDQVNYSKAPWAREPWQCVNYVSCHDNHTLWDRLTNCCSDASKKDRIEMHKLANTIVFTCQGIPFLHAGVEMLRTKYGVENSFESPDSINQINWNWKSEHYEVFEYYRDLIQLRKAHPAFRMTSTSQIQKHLQFFDFEEKNLIGFHLFENANGDDWTNILVYFNGNSETKKIEIPGGDWEIVCQNGQFEKGDFPQIKGGSRAISKHSALILKN